MKQKQLIDIEIHGHDPDTVEDKNTKYQRFTVDDLYENKAVALDLRYDADPRWFYGHEEKVTDTSVFEGFHLVISAVDNLKFRKMLFEENEKSFHWIDLRSEGRTVMGLNKHTKNTRAELMKSVEGDLNEEGSCQLQVDLDAGRVQLGNQIIATIGAQWVLNWLRGTTNPPKFIHHF